MGSWQSDIAPLLPKRVAGELNGLPGGETLEEIRLRVNRRVQALTGDGETLLECRIDENDCRELLESLSRHSLYACERELDSGYITLVGGCRAGVCGAMRTLVDGRLKLVDVTGFNIRIARELIGCADAALSLMLDENGGVAPSLIVSSPGAGKTTMLRDIARSLSYGRLGLRPRKVCIADERGELAGGFTGVPSLDVGPRTDVMDGCPKGLAMELMTRSMSPEVIVTDEIGGREDALAVREALRRGVAVIASAHGRVGRGGYKTLAPDGADCFERVIYLERDAHGARLTRVI